MPIPTSEQIDAYALAPAQLATALQGLNETAMQYVPAQGETKQHSP